MPSMASVDTHAIAVACSRAQACLASGACGFPKPSRMEAMITLTGFHGAHVFGGAIMLSVVLYRAMSGQFSAQHHDAVEATSLYWHFVDVVWVCLFSILYIIPTK